MSELVRVCIKEAENYKRPSSIIRKIEQNKSIQFKLTILRTGTANHAYHAYREDFFDRLVDTKWP